MGAPAGAIVLTVLVAYILAYIYYGKKILQEKVVKADPNRPTPAYTKYDGIDYVPTNKYVLYGHHFASIAGAGPIVGPAIAMAYGWFLPIIWVLFGNVFIGAVHDYLSLMASVRHGGLSIMSVSENVMGRKARYVFLLYVYAALILVLAAFISVAAKLMASIPSVATLALLYMPIAIGVGLLLYRTGLTPAQSSIIGVVMLFIAIAYAMKYPFLTPTTKIAGFTIDPYHMWIILLALYSFLASVLPVWYLLQPRDYLNAYVLWSFVLLGVVGGLIVIAKPLSGPAYTSFAPKIFAGEPTPFWPAIPLIIACGALSGFHSVVASGTTSKQLANELDALFVGYGGMLTEGAVSSFAVILPIALAWKQPDFPQLLKAMGVGQETINAYISKNILVLDKVHRFTYGYGYMLGKAFGSVTTVGSTMAKFAAMALASFILTTLDTATRLGRFAWQEMFDWLEEKSRTAYVAIANRYVASALAVIMGVVLAYPNVVIGGKPAPAYNVIWPAFAGTNQLLAALALLTAALWAYAVLQVRGSINWLIQVPAWFLWITVTTGLAWWTVKVMPKLPTIQKYGAGSLVVISLIIDFLLIYLYVQGLSKAKIAKTAPARR
ncbi:carbon starvation protein A [Pyrofollis japonicus]|uniref:carbon starvation CstA family protein n=1 Tax=Pyrofollis japonicus TaxID=3060460 RepID=UPI00295BF775|nr:carbon starvation protein A [Pyrofollis japonicus]BEP16892.1 carbon starvation protein A [Pyrofollis japonicus]